MMSWMNPILCKGEDSKAAPKVVVVAYNYDHTSVLMTRQTLKEGKKKPPEKMKGYEFVRGHVWLEELQRYGFANDKAFKDQDTSSEVPKDIRPFWDAAKREFTEETGMECELSPQGIVRYVEDGYNLLVFKATVRNESKVRAPEKGRDNIWVAKAQVASTLQRNEMKAFWPKFL
ncbi:hypothetical protein CROQUDRAFT_335437 [Cronartium quercuum f. sp. fusiforme G11]|uniref:Nudix hydrolase domain-containing protein n=1 Tax=Cronartium quercuum f. sp. fusiforme G11 TaxID=708437 RepID=A0A9P6NAK8_9BASI|nr:hypothetical protein CROQUDRAFT_335437 [Cronartium quercuum f. sp. fusiforme G11]